ncbi:hypothetical protein ACFQPA_00325 [Halomarina halobia]|uniref:DUF1059 domain-containing protein n=1 Tax=Halomarina halobia TaxID=3033386 RepID=A0ABD6A8E6_9EURY|nr:hypothetical protein [Halomarina sp. PSR21]
MVWEFQCPVDDCEYSNRDNEEAVVIEGAQEHVRDAHGDMPTRDEVEEYVIGPG